MAKEITTTTTTVKTTMSSQEIVLVAAILSLTLIESMGTWMVCSFVPQWMEDQGLNSDWAGIVFAGTSIGNAVAAAASPVIIKRVTNVRVMVVSPLVMAGMHILMAFAPLLASGTGLGVLLTILRTLLGLAEGLLNVAATAVILRVAPDEQSASLVGASEGLRAIGVVLGSLVGAPLYQAFGWTVPFVCAGGAVVLVSLGLSVYMLYASPSSQEHTSTKELSFLEIMDTQMVAVLLIQMVGFCISAASTPILDPYLEAPPFNLSPAQVGLVFGLLSIIDIIGAGVTGPLATIIGAFPLFYAAQVCCLIGTLLLGAGPQTLFVVTLGEVGAYVGGYPPVICSFVIAQRVFLLRGRNYKDYSEIIGAITMVSVAVSMGIGQLGAGALQAVVGFRGVFLVLLALPVLLIIFVMYAFHPSVLGAELPQIAEASESLDTGVPPAQVVGKQDTSAPCCLPVCDAQSS